MEIEQFLHGIRWDIISILSRGPMNPSQIADELKTSVPNVSQQLKLMELSGLVHKQRIKSDALNKPRVQYVLKTPLHFVASCDMGSSYKGMFDKESCLRSLVFALMNVQQKGVFEVLLKHFIEYEEIFADAQYVAIAKITQEAIDILIITEKHLGKLRGELANKKVKACGYTFNVSLWSHTPKEFEAGVQSKEEYFMNFVKNGLVHIIDPHGFMYHLREEQK